jgi:hypothetical protein
MRAGVLLVLGLCCIVGTTLDTFSSIFGLIALAKADYWVSRVMVGGLGIIMTLGVAGTKSIIDGRAPAVLVFLWLLCMVADIATNIISFSHFVVANGTISSDVAVGPKQLWELALANPKQAIIGAGGVAAVTACAIGILYCLDPAKRTHSTAVQ